MSTTHGGPPEEFRRRAEAFVRNAARAKNWELHPEPDFLSSIEEGLAANLARYGYFLCPCREGSGDRAKDRDIICPCAYCVPDQAEYGHCFCGLYLTPDYAATGKIPESIPERRPPELDS